MWTRGASLALALVVVLAAPAPAGARRLVTELPSVVPWPKPVPVGTFTLRPQGRPRGVILVYHGGGWGRLDPLVAEDQMRPWVAAGFVAVAPDFRSFLSSLVGAIRAAQDARRDYGRAMPICAVGSSTGANLALLVTEQLPDIACVTGQAAITNLRTIAPVPSHSGAGNVLRVARFNLSPVHLDDFSPAQHTKLLGDRRVLLIAARSDRTAPLAQSLEMRRRARANVRVVALPAGPDSVAWEHSAVSAKALASAHALERRWVIARMAEWSSAMRRSAGR
jgi:acetyl esterase/lipase